MKLKTEILFLVVVILGTAVTGCESKNKPKSGDVYENADGYMDKAQYNDVIRTMGDELMRNPYDRRARLLLAQAYAAKAGIFIRQYTDLAREIIESSQAAERFFNDRGVVLFERLRQGMADQGSVNIVTALEKAYRAAWRISDLIRKFETVPSLQSPAHLDDLKLAIQILEDEPDYRGGPAIYRGLLRMVLLRFHIKTQYQLPELRNCRINFKLLSDQLHRVHDELALILSDIALGTLDQRRQQGIWAAAQKMDESFNEAIQLLGRYHIGGDVDVSAVIKPLNQGRCQ